MHYHYPNHLSLDEIIYDFYYTCEYKPTTFTCDNHLKCNGGPYPSCLDWSEICNRRIDCLDGGLDEEHCWQLEINQCKDDEYRCRNGQCIPQSFYQDDGSFADCVDTSGEPFSYGFLTVVCAPYDEPSFDCEDAICNRTPLTSSCVKKRTDLLMETMYSSKNSLVSENCWSPFKCLINFEDFQMCQFYLAIFILLIEKVTYTTGTVPLLHHFIYAMIQLSMMIFLSTSQRYLSTI